MALVSKLREKREICHRFSYKDPHIGTAKPKMRRIYLLNDDRDKNKSADFHAGEGIPKQLRGAFHLLFDSIRALIRENYEILWPSVLKTPWSARTPLLASLFIGTSRLSSFWKTLKRRVFIEIRKKPRSGACVVVGFSEQIN